MGWSSGSRLMSEIIEDVMGAVDDEARVEVYKALILNFENHDCDTLDECLGEDSAFDRAWKLVGNEINEDEEDYESEDYDQD